jgi:hypothetical protein
MSRVLGRDRITRGSVKSRRALAPAWTQDWRNPTPFQEHLLFSAHQQCQLAISAPPSPLVCSARSATRPGQVGSATATGESPGPWSRDHQALVTNKTLELNYRFQVAKPVAEPSGQFTTVLPTKVLLPLISLYLPVPPVQSNVPGARVGVPAFCHVK